MNIHLFLASVSHLLNDAGVPGVYVYFYWVRNGFRILDTFPSTLGQVIASHNGAHLLDVTDVDLREPQIFDTNFPARVQLSDMFQET